MSRENIIAILAVVVLVLAIAYFGGFFGGETIAPPPAN
jgi:hypothetical protein